MNYSTQPGELAFSFLNDHIHNTWKGVVVCQSAQRSNIPVGDKKRKSFKNYCGKFRGIISPQNINYTQAPSKL